MIPVVCSAKIIDNLVLLDNTSGAGNNIPAMEYSSKEFFNADLEATIISYVDTRPTITFRDNFLNITRVIQSQEGIWKAYSVPLSLLDTIRNILYIVCRVKATMPENISGNDNETWFGKMDLQSGHVTLIARLHSTFVDGAVAIYSVTEDKVLYGYGRINQIKVFNSVDIATNVITTIWNTGTTGNPPTLFSEITYQGDLMVYGNQTLNQGILTVRVFNVTQQVELDSIEVDIVSSLNIDVAEIVGVSGYRFNGDLVYMGIGIDPALGNRTFKLLVVNFKSGEIYQIIDGAVDDIWQRVSFFISRSLRVFIDRNNERRLSVYDVRPIESTDLLKSNGNILAIAE